MVQSGGQKVYYDCHGDWVGVTNSKWTQVYGTMNIKWEGQIEIAEIWSTIQDPAEDFFTDDMILIKPDGPGITAVRGAGQKEAPRDPSRHSLAPIDGGNHSGTRVALEAYGVDGRRIAVISGQNTGDGIRPFGLDTRNLPPGLIVIRPVGPRRTAPLRYFSVR